MHRSLAFVVTSFLVLQIGAPDLTAGAQDLPEVVVLSDRVGEIIDQEERRRFRLFFATRGFQSAVFLKLPDGTYVAEVTYETDAQKMQRRITHTEEEIALIRDHIEHYGELRDLGTRLPPQKSRQATPALEAPKKQATGAATGVGAAQGMMVGAGCGAVAGLLFGIVIPAPEPHPFVHISKGDVIIWMLAGGAAVGGLIGLFVGAISGSVKADENPREEIEE